MADGRVRFEWDPFSEIDVVRREVNRLFESYGLGRYAPEWASGFVPSTSAFQPPVNVHETDEEVLVSAELPSFDPAKLEVDATGNTLTLRGERIAENPGDVRFHRKERAFGPFSRAVTLPSRVESEKASAEYHAGVLTVRIPKAPEVRPRQITVRAS